MLLLNCILIFPFFCGPAFADELISARCQSKCLHDMELRYQDNSEQRKNLKHHIIQMCKDDATCSACAIPCREGLSDAVACKETACTAESLDKSACESSCDFLQQIFTEKPGSCPMANNSSNYECSALCNLDGDCGETWKCCSSGCNRKCVPPEENDPNLLPVPTDITVHERKRRRSILIRWDVGSLSKSQQSANSNLFVVQWRWAINMEKSQMTDWQTVTVRNKPSAILKHLLSPGRFYEFRVGAVGKDGSRGFSQNSRPFKMSTEARAPHAPRDISLVSAKLTSIGLWNQKLTWNPPQSDLPVKNYVVSWAASSLAEADSFEEMMRRKAILETEGHDKRSADEEEIWGIEQRDRHSVVVPSHSTQTEISGLFPNSVYIVEIHALVDSSEGELQGEKGIVFVRTDDAFYSSTQMPSSFSPSSSISLDVPTERTEEIQTTEVNEMDIATPFFENGQLQTTVNWLNSRICAPGKNSFVVRIKKGYCREYQTSNNADARWHDIKVHECSAVLSGLSFDCDYHVQVTQGSEHTSSLSSMFSTQPCGTTPSVSAIPCLSLSAPIVCSPRETLSLVYCRWNRDETSTDTVIGYRVVLSSASNDLHNITINPPQTREISYDDLRHGDMYTVEIQPITNRGLGRVLSTNFVSPSENLESDVIERFPGGEIIELPLESASRPISALLLLVTVLFVILRIY